MVQTSRAAGPDEGDEAVRRTITHVSLNSVFKFALLMAMTVGLIIMLAGGVLYFIASTTGVVSSFETFMHHSGYADFRVQSSTVFGILLVADLVGAAVWVALMLLATFIFNLVAEASGGITATFKE